MDSRPVADPSGWEALMHGVFAIAMTLLVLDIRVPDASSIDSGSALIEALSAELPRYVAYVLGFLLIGTYWINMHRGLRMLQSVDHWFMVLGLLFLMIISATPFATALLAEYIGADNGQDRVVLVFFTAWQLVLATLAYVSIRYAFHRRQQLLRPDLTEAGLRDWLRLVSLGPTVWLVALVTALFVSSAITLAIMAVLLAIFMLEPPMRDRRADAS